MCLTNQAWMNDCRCEIIKSGLISVERGRATGCSYASLPAEGAQPEACVGCGVVDSTFA